MKGNFLFLGTGASMGVPVIGCPCEVCHSTALVNKRMRSSGLVQVNGTNLLIDVGPDFRMQALENGMEKLDALLLTHVHFDHIAGMDDLRIFCFRQKKKILCLASKESLMDLKVRYHYLFTTHKKGIPKFSFHQLEQDFGYTTFLGIKIGFLTYEQQGMKVTGYRIGDFAYVTDIRKYSKNVFSILDGVKTLVVSALRETSSEAHFSIDEAVSFANHVGAERAFFTHIAHELEHNKTNKNLPENMKLAHDGLELEFTYDE